MKMNKKPTELTRAELEVMQIIWKLGNAFLGEIVEEYPEPKPAYTTVSTVILTLRKKGFIAYKTIGKSNRYYPVISKEEYRSKFMRRVMQNFFNDSPGQVLSFFAESGNLSIEQYEELKRVAQQIVEKSGN